MASDEQRRAGKPRDKVVEEQLERRDRRSALQQRAIELGRASRERRGEESARGGASRARQKRELLVVGDAQEMRVARRAVAEPEGARVGERRRRRWRAVVVAGGHAEELRSKRTEDVDVGSSSNLSLKKSSFFKR